MRVRVQEYSRWNGVDTVFTLIKALFNQTDGTKLVLQSSWINNSNWMLMNFIKMNILVVIVLKTLYIQQKSYSAF